MLFSQFYQWRRLVFDQSSPVHPVSESRGGQPERDIHRSSSRRVLLLSNIGWHNILRFQSSKVCLMACCDLVGYWLLARGERVSSWQSGSNNQVRGQNISPNFVTSFDFFSLHVFNQPKVYVITCCGPSPAMVPWDEGILQSL